MALSHRCKKIQKLPELLVVGDIMFVRRQRLPPRRRGGSSMTVSDSDPDPRATRAPGQWTRRLQLASESAVLLPGLGLPGRVRVTGICD